MQQLIQELLITASANVFVYIFNEKILKSEQSLN